MTTTLEPIRLDDARPDVLLVQRRAHEARQAAGAARNNYLRLRDAARKGERRLAGELLAGGGVAKRARESLDARERELSAARLLADRLEAEAQRVEQAAAAVTEEGRQAVAARAKAQHLETVRRIVAVAAELLELHRTEDRIARAASDQAGGDALRQVKFERLRLLPLARLKLLVGELHEAARRGGYVDKHFLERASSCSS